MRKAAVHVTVRLWRPPGCQGIGSSRDSILERMLNLYMILCFFAYYAQLVIDKFFFATLTVLQEMKK
jgi:hypothetical protein